MQIVVGTDGSAASVPALRWAWREALAHGGSLEAVCAWDPPVLTTRPPVLGPDLHATTAELEKIVHGHLAGIEAEDGGVVATTVTVVVGPPVPALLKAAGGADLLVVGARGLGGFKGLLLGSVSQQCIAARALPRRCSASCDHLNHQSRYSTGADAHRQFRMGALPRKAASPSAIRRAASGERWGARSANPRPTMTPSRRLPTHHDPAG